MSLDGVDVQDAKSSGLTVACGLSQSRRVSCDGARGGRRWRKGKDELRRRWRRKDGWKCLLEGWLWWV